MSELVPTLETLISDVRAGRPVALCSIVATRGSVPQSPGATMIVRSDYQTLGTLGGGCVEAEVKKRAYEFLQQRKSGLLDYVLDHDFGWDDGLICGGRMSVGVASLTQPADLPPFENALHLAKQHKAASIPLVVEHDGAMREYKIHLEIPPTLLIVGAGHVGQAVARLAADLDFHVVVLDDRADFASADRFQPNTKLLVGDIARTLTEYPLDDGCYVVIVTRGHQHDEQAVEAVVRRPAAYIGLIGSKRKSRLIFDDLRAAGVSDDQLARVHTPIGLPIQAITVNEIAVSIASELVQVRRQKLPTLVEGPLPV